MPQVDLFRNPWPYKFIDTLEDLEGICISETNLNSSLQHNNKRLHLNVHKLARVDNTNNNKRDGVTIYFQEFLGTRQVEFNGLNEYLIFEVCFQN